MCNTAVEENLMEDTVGKVEGIIRESLLHDTNKLHIIIIIIVVVVFFYFLSLYIFYYHSNIKQQFALLAEHLCSISLPVTCFTFFHLTHKSPCLWKLLCIVGSLSLSFHTHTRHFSGSACPGEGTKASPLCSTVTESVVFLFSSQSPTTDCQRSRKTKRQGL